MTQMRYFLLLVLYLVIPEGLASQSEISYFWNPRLYIGYKVSGTVSIDIQGESRLELDRNHFFTIQHERTELSSYVSWKAAVDKKWSLGYLAQRKGHLWSHRFIQQFSFVQKRENGRMGHRLVAEENLGDGSISSVRLRYRFSWERALEGDRIDLNELYLKISNEYLATFDFHFDEFEVRFAPVLGWELSRSVRIEAGPEVRIIQIQLPEREINIFGTLSWYQLF